MAAILSLILSGFAVVGIYKFFTKPDFRTGLLAEFSASPVETTFALLWCACWLLFFWGVFVPALGTIKVPIMGERYELWAVSGIASFGGFAITGIYMWLKTPRHPR